MDSDNLWPNFALGGSITLHRVAELIAASSRHVDKEFCFHEILEHKREGLRIVSRSPGESIDL